jgi:phosphohistidine phosphatase SixA
VSLRLCLFRHGIAQDRDDPDCPPDPERALTREGETKTLRAALGLKALGVAPRAVLCSPLLRARQTAELAATALGFPVAEIQLTSALEPDAPPGQLRQRLAALSGEVLAVGHAPNLDRVIAALLDLPIEITALRKAGAAFLDVDARQLSWLLTSRTLRALGRLAE